MQPSQPSHFTCKACGHSFAGSWDVISKQPTCPKCRTFGQLVDAKGQPVSGRQNVVRVQHPGAGGKAPMRGQGGPVGFNGGHQAGYSQYEDDVVEVNANVAYGERTNKKSLMTMVILIVLGLGIVGTLGFIVSVLSDSSARDAELKKEREVVLDPKDFERAVDDSVAKVRTLLNNVPDAEVQETTNLDEALKAIQDTGGTPPTWTAPPAPGTPFRTHGFLIKAKDQRTGLPVVGFVMLLYYKTAAEVEQARAEVDRHLGGDTRNYSIHTNPAMWFAAYSGVNYKGVVKDALTNAMRLGAPASYKQFTDRVGATMRDELKD